MKIAVVRMLVRSDRRANMDRAAGFVARAEYLGPLKKPEKTIEF